MTDPRSNYLTCQQVIDAMANAAISAKYWARANPGMDWVLMDIAAGERAASLEYGLKDWQFMGLVLPPKADMADQRHNPFQQLLDAAKWTVQVHTDPTLSHEIGVMEWLTDLQAAIAAAEAGEKTQPQMPDGFRELLVELIENDGGDGSRRYDASRMIAARDKLRTMLAAPQPKEGQ